MEPRHNDKKSEINNDNNSLSNNNRCADSEDNNGNNMGGNFISASTSTPSNSNADNAPPGRNKMNNVKRLPRFICYFICHPNGIVLRVLIRKRATSVSTFLSKILDILSKTSRKMNQLQCAECRANKEYFIEFLIELLLETLSSKGLIELLVERQVDKSTLSVTKKSSGTISSKDLNHNFENNVNSHPNHRLADAKQRSTE